MKNQRRGRRHFKLKASAGAYSDRYGPRLTRPTASAVPASGETDPWVAARPVLGLTAAIMPAGSAVLRRP